MTCDTGKFFIIEMNEFAGFEPSTQRYIRCAIDVAFGRCDAVKVWARDENETAEILEQMDVYTRLDIIRDHYPIATGLNGPEDFMGYLITLTAYDLSQKRLPSFQAYRFLYERLLGADIRPWLTMAFLAGAAHPSVDPNDRVKLLGTVTASTATACGWSDVESLFMPEWVDKIQSPHQNA